MSIIERISLELEMNHFDEAYRMLAENEQNLSYNGLFWNLKAVLCLKVGEFDTALKCLEKAMSITKENGDILYNYAFTLNSLNRHTDAALYFGLAYRYMDDGDTKNNLLSFYENSRKLKGIFEAAASPTKKLVVMLSSCGWGDIYQRMHHIARSLAMFGNRVIYIEPVVEAQLNSGNTTDLTMYDLKKFTWDSMREVDGVKIIQPIMVRQNSNNYVTNYTSLVQDIISAHSDDYEDAAVLVTYMPYQIDTIKQLEGSFYHIYECVDDHSDIEYAFWGDKRDLVWEQALMDTADAITTTATALYLERSVIEKRSNVSLSKNAVNEADFISIDTGIPEILRTIPEPRVVYTGAIYEWFDTELFFDVVRANPDKSFIIIGFGNMKILDETLPNMYVLEPLKHSELINYLQYMQIGIIPFKFDTDLIVNTDPIKHYEYLACNLPVVTTMMPESGVFKPYTFLAENTVQFTDSLNRALNLTVNREIINEFLIENSWHSRAALLWNLSMENVSEFDHEDELKKIEEGLTDLSENFDFPLFNTLSALPSSFKNEEGIELVLKTAYENQPLKYIEKQYIRVLVCNNNLSELIKVIGASPHINEELKDELTYRLKEEEYGDILPIVSMCIKDISLFKKYSAPALSKHADLYTNYFNYILGVVQELSDSFNDEKNSPVYQYLIKNVNGNSKYRYSILGKNEEEIEELVIELIELGETEFVMEIIQQIENNITPLSDQLFIDIIKARVLAVDGRISEVFKFLKEIERTRPYHRAGLLLAELYQKEGNRIRAIQGYTKYIGKLGDRQKNQLSSLISESAKPKISLITTTSSGCNARGLATNLPEHIKDKYDVRLFKEQNHENYEAFVKESDLVITTQANYPFNNGQINIELWHGFPLKSMALMDMNEEKSNEFYNIWWENVDAVTSYSSMFNTLFNSCIGLRGDKYRITGAPRNDLLNYDNRYWFSDYCGADLASEKIIMYTPTFRNSMFNPSKTEGERSWSNVFGFKDFDHDMFNQYLELNHIYLFIKLHWVEEAIVKEQLSSLDCPRIKLITEADIVASSIDFYELLGSVDLLVTDYSSIFFDFLLLDRPVVFTPTDINSYKENRGFLLEPYEFWTPGPKVLDQMTFQEEVGKSLSDKDYFSVERKQVRSITHQHYDFDSSQRVWELIDQELSIKMD